MPSSRALELAQIIMDFRDKIATSRGDLSLNRLARLIDRIMGERPVYGEKAATCPRCLIRGGLVAVFRGELEYLVLKEGELSSEPSVARIGSVLRYRCRECGADPIPVSEIDSHNGYEYPYPKEVQG